MPQISLYMDRETMRKITKAARAEQLSVSAWVRKRLERPGPGEWPEGFFESFGVDPDPDFRRPDQPGTDHTRESL